MSKLKRFINRHSDGIVMIAFIVISIAIIAGATLTIFKCVLKPLSEEKIEYFTSVATKVYSENVSAVLDLPDDTRVEVTNSFIAVYSSEAFECGRIIGTVENGELSLRYDREMFDHVSLSICLGIFVYILCLFLFVVSTEIIEKIKRRRRYIHPNKKTKKKNPQ